jgi:hypothetical protein
MRLSSSFAKAIMLALVLTACGGTTTAPRPASTEVDAIRTDTARTVMTEVASERPLGQEPTRTSSTIPAPALNSARQQIPPRASYSHPYEITEEYDRFKDQTVVTLRPRGAEFLRGRSLAWSYLFSGNEPALPEVVLLTVFSGGDTWKYIDCHDLSILVDDNHAMNLPSDWDGQVEDNGDVGEWVMVGLAIDEFLEIVNATKVELKLCNDEFALSSDQMEALRDVASRTNPR